MFIIRSTNETGLSVDAPAAAAERAPAYAEILGEADAQRVERHIQMLRRFSELALREAERIDRAAEAREAAAEELRDAGDPAPKAGPTSDVSLALYRLTRIVRLNILLEQTLVDALRHPERAVAGAKVPAPKGDGGGTAREAAAERKKAEEARLIAQRKEECAEFVRMAAWTDDRLDREGLDLLLDDLKDELDRGLHDEALLTRDALAVGYLFVLSRNIDPEWLDIFTGAEEEKQRREAEMAAAGLPVPPKPPPRTPDALPYTRRNRGDILIKGWPRDRAPPDG